MRIRSWTFSTIVLTTSLSFLQCACATPNDVDSSKTFLQTFYSWYTPIALKENSLPAVDITLKKKAGVFSQTLYAALTEDSDARKKQSGYSAGLDFDPFLATQDPCDEYEVGNVTHEGNEVKAEVYAVCEGKKRADPDIEVALSRKGGQWIIDNFYYPPYGATGRDLLTTLRLLKQTRENNKKS